MRDGDAGASDPLGEPDPATTRVNFHAHTVFSDGTQSPEALAASLAADGVRVAALTDHVADPYHRFHDPRTSYEGTLRNEGIPDF